MKTQFTSDIQICMFAKERQTSHVSARYTENLLRDVKPNLEGRDALPTM